MNLNKEQLETRINELAGGLGIIKLQDILAGGVVSDVYSAVLEVDGKSKNIVVKYTKDEISASHIFAKSDVVNSFSGAQTEHNLDVEIQKKLGMATPNIIKHFPDNNITLMENFAKAGYTLLQSRLIDDVVPDEAAEKLGITLAEARNNFSQKTTGVKQVESSQTQFDERFLELKVLLYNGRIDIFNKIEEDFLKNSDFLTWTDGDQKNFALNDKGDVIFFDLGRSILCDPDFMLPNLLGHLGLFVIAGYLDVGSKFINTCRDAFVKTYTAFDSNFKLDEIKFINYFTASLLHRGIALRWVDPRISANIGEGALKNACMHFGDIIFDKKKPVTTIDQLLLVLEKVAVAAKNGGYKRPVLK